MTKFGPWKVWCAGRREVEAPGARLEVHRVERVGIDVAVPAHDVEGMAVEDVALIAVAHAQRELELAVGLDRLELGRAVEVALGVRRVLEQLAVAVAVAVGRLDLAGRVEADPELLDVLGQAPAVRRPARDDDVVLLAEGQASRTSCAARPRRGGCRRPRRPRRCGRSPRGPRSACRSRPRCRALNISSRRPLIASPPESTGLASASRCTWVSGTHSSRTIGVKLADLREPAGRVQVVEDRLVAREALVAEDLLGQQRAVAPRLGMTLRGHVAEADVAHRCPPRGCRAGPARARWLRTGP